MSRLHKWAPVVLAVSALGLAACGNAAAAGNTGSAATTTTTTTTTSVPAVINPSAGGTTTIATIPVKDRSPAGVAGKPPTVLVPPGAPPSQLESADLIVGTGPAVATGDSVTVQYVLATYSARKVIQTSWTSQPFSFTVGEGVIPGWDEGVIGMKAGGRRELIIPPSLGYGDESPGAGIAPNDTLVFVIDLLKIG